jgi:hypothetical protein
MSALSVGQADIVIALQNVGFSATDLAEISLAQRIFRSTPFPDVYTQNDVVQGSRRLFVVY